MATYRAVYWTDGRDSCVLTHAEHAHYSDEALIKEARECAEDIGLVVATGRLVLGEYTE